MIKSVNNYPITQIFDIDTRVVYKVPRYQREYSWRKEDFENLFDDVLENDPGYFLGTIICINQSSDAHSIQELELVDGQQRITTLSLLFAAIYDFLKTHEFDMDDEQRAELFNLLHKLVLKKSNEQIRLTPQIQNNNYDDYLYILSRIGIVSYHRNQPNYFTKRRISIAYEYFRERIVKMTNGRDNRMETVLEFLDKVNRASLVKIEVASYTDAYTLFEALNNRGKPLTAVDIIKNKLLAKLDMKEPGNLKNNFEHWNHLLAYLGDDYTVQERFFSQYYNAFRDDLKAVAQVPMATRSSLVQIHEKLIDHDAKEYLEKIFNAGQLYSLILSKNPDVNLKLSEIEKPIKDLERIKGAPSYSLILYLLVRQNALEQTNKHLALSVEILVCFFVRRNLTNTPPTGELIRLFITVIDKICTLRGDAIPLSIAEQLADVSATDEEFQKKLKGSIYDENVGVTRFILCKLAEQGMTKETWVDLWGKDNKQSVWTIEHIFPQGKKIPSPWIDMIANGDKEKATVIQQTHVHKLGNLTISGYNSELGNKNFLEKRDRTDAKERPVGFKNGLNLNEDLANATTWSVEQIDERTEKLVQKISDLFKLVR